MVRQKRTSVDSAKNRLETDPFQITVFFGVSGFKGNIDQPIPVIFCLFKGSICLFGRAKHFCCLFCQLQILCHATKQNIIDMCSCCKGNLRKYHRPHCFFSIHGTTGRTAFFFIFKRIRCQKCSGFSDKRFHRWEERFRFCSISLTAHLKINHMIFLMSAFIK